MLQAGEPAGAMIRPILTLPRSDYGVLTRQEMCGCDSNDLRMSRLQAHLYELLRSSIPCCHLAAQLHKNPIEPFAIKHNTA